MKEIQKRLLVVVLFFLLLFSVNFVSALEIKYPPIPGMPEILTPQEFIEKIKAGEIPSEKALSLYAQYLFYLSLMSGGFIALGAVILGGVKYLISGGNVEKMKGARETISSGILGLVIIFSSYILVTTINPQLAILAIGELPLPPEECGTDEDCPGEMVCQNGRCIAPPAATEEEAEVYVEIPLGFLIERLKQESEVASNIAAAIHYAGAEGVEENKIITNYSLVELSRCLKWLTDQCDCKYADTKGCPSSPPCDVAYCEGDPCDTNITVDPTIYLANGRPLIDSCPFEVGAIPFVTFNLREKIDEVMEMAAEKKAALLFHREKAEKQIPVLEKQLIKLELAEGLMRNVTPSPISRQMFVEMSKHEKTKTRWLGVWEEESKKTVTEFPAPPAHCCKPGVDCEITPSCAQCEDILFCYGNGWRGCETDSKIHDANPGDQGHQWYGYEDFPGYIKYNGAEFPVPSGGVHICDSNVFACGPDERCKSKPSSEHRKDPTNFYIEEEGNEDLINTIIEVFEGIYFDPGELPPLPPPWWTPPPAIPNSLQWPLIPDWPTGKTPPTFYSFGCVRPLCFEAWHVCCNGDTKRMHWGLDICVCLKKDPLGTDSLGLPIKAAAKGRVIKIISNHPTAGNYIVIVHNELGLSTRYLHLKEIMVAEGETVEAGTQIGTNGKSGGTDLVHVHFEVAPCLLDVHWCQAVDPMDYLVPLP